MMGFCRLTLVFTDHRGHYPLGPAADDLRGLCAEETNESENVKMGNVANHEIKVGQLEALK